MRKRHNQVPIDERLAIELRFVDATGVAYYPPNNTYHNKHPHAEVYKVPHVAYDYAADKNKITEEIWSLAVDYFNNVIPTEDKQKLHDSYCACKAKVSYDVKLIPIRGDNKVQLIAYGDLCPKSLEDDKDEYDAKYRFLKVDHLWLVVKAAIGIYNQRILWEHDHPMLSRVPGLSRLQMDEVLFEREHPKLARYPNLLKLLGIKYNNQ